jgi:hypothetical protein
MSLSVNLAQRGNYLSRKSFFLHTLPVIVANTFVLLLILDGAAIFLEQKLSG